MQIVDSPDNVRVLAVDDESTMIELYRLGLVSGTPASAPVSQLDALSARLFPGDTPVASGMAFDLALCRQGAEAVEEVRVAVSEGRPFAVIFMDVRMPPGIDGVQAAEQIRGLDPNVNIVIVTGYSDLSPREISRRVPPPEKLLYLQKPLRLHELHHFACSLCAKWQAEWLLRETNRELEALVDARVAQLAQVYEELKQVRERSLQAQHLAEIGEMSASIAHEIKNPLAGISSAVQVLRNALADDAPQRAVMDEILEQVDRVDNTVCSLLSFAKPWRAQPVGADIRVLVERVCSAAKGRSEYARIEFLLEGETDLLALLDLDLTEQVLWNVLQNAAEAMPQGGVVRINLARIPGGVRLTIADTGPGLAPDVSEKLFQPFFTTKTRGTGLGLAISKRIMEAQGGAIAISSIPGEGTVVVLEFPKG